MQDYIIFKLIKNVFRRELVDSEHAWKTPVKLILLVPLYIHYGFQFTRRHAITSGTKYVCAKLLLTTFAVAFLGTSKITTTLMNRNFCATIANCEALNFSDISFYQRLPKIFCFNKRSTESSPASL